MNKNKSLLIILIILIVSFSLFIGINILGKKDNKEEANTQQNPVSNTQNSINKTSSGSTTIENVESSEPAFKAPEDWLTYVDPDYGFSFRYPADWAIKTSVEEGYKSIDIVKDNYRINLMLSKTSGQGFGGSLIEPKEISNLKKYTVDGIDLYRVDFENYDDFTSFGPATYVRLFPINSPLLDSNTIPIYYGITLGDMDYRILIDFEIGIINMDLVTEINNIISTIKWAK